MKTKLICISTCMLMLATSISFLVVANENIDDCETIYFREIITFEDEGNTVLQTTANLNNPPNTPTQPSGPTTVYVGNWYLYTTVTTDPDGDNVSYGWDGGDGIVNYWTSFYPSGETCRVCICFCEIGTYKLQVKAKDQYGTESNFSLPIYVTAIESTTNHPPNIPTNPNPANQAFDVPINTILSWTGGDPDVGDTVSYDVYFGSSLLLMKIASNISSNSHNPGLLSEGVTYSWRIVAWDNHGLATHGPIWYFTTAGTTENPPLQPILSGPTVGRVGRSYVYSAYTTDPEGDNVYYLFDWSDGTDSGWIGPFNSVGICQESHIWTVKGNYAVKVKAKDIHDAESVWSDPITVSMPKIKSSNFRTGLFVNMMERFASLHHFTFFTDMKTSNREIDLGYASIWGDGNTSILNAVAENDLRIRTDSTTEIVDFFIDYDMNCEGLVDEGIIWLTLTLNGENLTANFTQTPFSKNGTLYLHDVEITRGESLGFVINVIYGNAYPFYHNDTSATGVAIVSKNLLFSNLLGERYPFFSRFVTF